MPKYEDLEFIRDKILSIGDEINVKKKLGLSTEILPIPEKKEEIPEENLAEEFDNLIDEIKEDFDKGLLVEEDVSEENLEKPSEEENFDLDSFLDSDKKENLDNAFEDILPEENKEEEAEITEKITGEQEEIKEQEISDLLDSLGLGEEKKEESFEEKPLFEEFEEHKEETIPIEKEEVVKEEEIPFDKGLEELLSTPLTTEEEENKKEENMPVSEISEIENLSNLGIEDQLFETKEEKVTEMDDFLKGLSEEKKEESIENLFEEENKEVGDILVTDENVLKDLAGDFISESIEEEKKEEIIEKESEEPISDMSSFSDLDQLLEEKQEEKQEQSNRAQLLEVKEEEMPVDVSGIENLFEEPEETQEKEEKEEGVEEENKEEAIEEVSSLETIGEDIDLSNLDQFTTQPQEVLPEIEEEQSFLKEIPVVEEEAEEVEEKKEKKEEIQKVEKPKIGKEDIELTDEQIKQILLSLSSLPKEAELKIARAIVSDKYSDKQLKPLIDALLEKEKSQAIIKIYEKITGDKSLSKVTAVKYTGEEFEEKQKSFAYLFQKNILPILYRITAISIFTLIILLLIINVIMPTIRATHYYNMGKKNIDNKKFNEVEPYFERAYEIQPRYNEVVIYARKYRENKRYLEAEKKYNLALQMKENRDLKLEIGDFFREIKDYERSIRYYSQLKQENDRDIKVLLGMAKTYYDWAEEIPVKLEDAKELYYDVLDIDKNNKDALYGNMNIFIKEKNNAEVLKYYKYIEKKFKDSIDPVSYFNLANYFIDTNQIEEVKNVLEKALKRSNKLKMNLPEIDYLYARYKNSLNIFNEEKTHLENALIKFNKMSKENPDLFGTQKYQKLLAKVYNDLGENYDRFSKANIDAEKYYLMAINTDPDYGKPYFNLANFELKYKVDMESAKNNYLQAEERGFVNDRLNYNLGWIYFKQEDYIESFKRINRLLEKYPENSNLKFFLGTIFYKLENFDFAEGFLLEVYTYFNNLKQIYAPLEMDVKEDRTIVDMLFKVSNNLGAAYQKKFEKTRNSKYLVWATKYYSESMEYYDKLKEYPLELEKREEELSEAEIKLKKFEITKATQNLRMVLYPDAGKDEPIIFEDFSLDYESSL